MLMIKLQYVTTLFEIAATVGESDKQTISPAILGQQGNDDTEMDTTHLL